VPAFTAIPSRSRRHAAIPESRSLPATILALGQTARASFSKNRMNLPPSRSRREKLQSDLLHAAKTWKIFVI